MYQTVDVNVVQIYPIDGCSSWKTWPEDNQDCFTPLRFTVDDDGDITNYCIEDNTAWGWQLCSTPDTKPEDSNDNFESSTYGSTTNVDVTNPVWSSSGSKEQCNTKRAGAHALDSKTWLLCWTSSDVTGNPKDLGGDYDPYNQSEWTLLIDCFNGATVCDYITRSN